MLPVQLFIQVWAVIPSSVRGTSVHPELRTLLRNVSKSLQVSQTTPKASSFISNSPAHQMRPKNKKLVISFSQFSQPSFRELLLSRLYPVEHLASRVALPQSNPAGSGDRRRTGRRIAFRRSCG